MTTKLPWAEKIYRLTRVWSSSEELLQQTGLARTLVHAMAEKEVSFKWVIWKQEFSTQLIPFH